MSTTYAVLGCGWLGLPLAQSFLKSGRHVRGSVRSDSAFKTLTDVGLEAHQIRLYEDHIQGDIFRFLEGVSRLYIILPPGLRKNPNRNFVAVIAHLVPHIIKQKVKEVVFSSSTGVFGATQGIVTPNTTPLPDTESGRQLLAVEQLLLAQTSFLTQILRLGGLVDQDRHPVQSLARRNTIPEAQAPVNLIHRADAIGLLNHLPTKAPWQSVYHGVLPWHPSKRDFYDQAAREFGLFPLSFSEVVGATNKIVTDDRIQNGLAYRFKEPQLGLKSWTE